MTVEIHLSAQKHGVRTTDILHAIRHALFVAPLSDGKTLHLGPDASGNLLEVVTVTQANRIELAIHAMKMRKIYSSLLPGGGSHGR